MTEKATRIMLLTAAIFNWAVAFALLFNAQLLFNLFRVTPLPTEPLFLHLFAGLVFAFGVGYFWASRDPAGNIPVIKLGILGKIIVVLVVLADILLGHVSWQMMIVASADLLYAILFWRALQPLKQGKPRL